jgi:hypothetical protein
MLGLLLISGSDGSKGTPSGVFFLSNILLKGQISKYMSWLIPEQKNFQHQDMFGKASDIFF